jgi:hypothetical protein
MGISINIGNIWSGGYTSDYTSCESKDDSGKRKFDTQKHHDALMEVERVIAATYMLCEGLEYASDNLPDGRYEVASTGAFRLMRMALSTALNEVSEASGNFKWTHDEVKWPFEVKG